LIYSAKFKWTVESYNNSHVEDEVWLHIPEIFSSLEIKAVRESLLNYFKINNIQIDEIHIKVSGKVRTINIETSTDIVGNEHWLYFKNYTKWLYAAHAT